MMLLFSATVYSQAVILIKNDTNIAYPIKKVKYLIKESFRARECDTLLKIEKLRSDSLNAALQSRKDEVSDLKQVITNNREQMELQTIQIQNRDNTIEEKDKQITKQKVYKWIAIIGGAVVAILEGYVIFSQAF
jgi:hypothetical protein